MNENLGTSFVRTVGWALSSSLIFTILLASPAARSQAVSGAIPGDTGSAGMHSENQCENRGLPNANQLALLRWYSANTVTNVQIGGHPNGAAFDGANVWLVNVCVDTDRLAERGVDRFELRIACVGRRCSPDVPWSGMYKGHRSVMRGTMLLRVGQTA